MSHYASKITAAISHKDPETAAVVEQFMRDETGGALDHLDTAGLIRLARQAEGDAVALHAVGQLAMVCSANELTLPAWAA
jgi:hypothetical protein